MKVEECQHEKVGNLALLMLNYNASMPLKMLTLFMKNFRILNDLQIGLCRNLLCR